MLTKVRTFDGIKKCFYPYLLNYEKGRLGHGSGVYFLKTNDYIKIGGTGNLYFRLLAQIDCLDVVRDGIIGILDPISRPGCTYHTLEKEIQKKFDSIRLGRFEHFKDDGSIREFLEDEMLPIEKVYAAFYTDFFKTRFEAHQSDILSELNMVGDT